MDTGVRDFLAGETHIIVGTTALGAGVHRNDVRCVLISGLPFGMVELIQQAGRAGRDGGTAEVHVVVTDDEVERTTQQAAASMEFADICLSRFLSGRECRRSAIGLFFDDEARSCFELPGAQFCDSCVKKLEALAPSKTGKGTRIVEEQPTRAGVESEAEVSIKATAATDRRAPMGAELSTGSNMVFGPHAGSGSGELTAFSEEMSSSRLASSSSPLAISFAPSTSTPSQGTGQSLASLPNAAVIARTPSPKPKRKFMDLSPKHLSPDRPAPGFLRQKNKQRETREQQQRRQQPSQLQQKGPFRSASVLGRPAPLFSTSSSSYYSSSSTTSAPGAGRSRSLLNFDSAAVQRESMAPAASGSSLTTIQHGSAQSGVLQRHASVKREMLAILRQLHDDKCAFCWVIGAAYDHQYQKCPQLQMDKWRNKSIRGLFSWVGDATCYRCGMPRGACREEAKEQAQCWLGDDPTIALVLYLFKRRPGVFADALGRAKALLPDLE
ncbi:hypothetical protein OC835_007158, partial [Tilletia horrida]